MGYFKDAGHLFRFALLFVVGFVIFLVARHFIVPKTFGEYGHYRGAAMGEITARPVHDERAGWIITLIGIPSAFILHGYVGFIFGSLKANPWWNSPLMPVVFIFSAMVSGIAAVMLLYMLTTKLRKLKIDMACVDTIAKYLFYIFIIDFSLEMLDLIHRIYEADESFRSISFMVHSKLYFSQIVLQLGIGTCIPLFLLALVQVKKLSATARKIIYIVSGSLIEVAVISMRWNVVIGGQLFSKSFLGYTTYKMSLVTREGLLMSIALLILPLGILWVLVKLLPPWPDREPAALRALSKPVS